jgi:hypothetical protein
MFSSSVLILFLDRCKETIIRFQRPKEVVWEACMQVAHNSEPGRICSKYVEILESLQL